MPVPVPLATNLSRNGVPTVEISNFPSEELLQLMLGNSYTSPVWLLMMRAVCSGNGGHGTIASTSLDASPHLKLSAAELEVKWPVKPSASITSAPAAPMSWKEL